jgi:hypothetical protein
MSLSVVWVEKFLLRKLVFQKVSRAIWIEIDAGKLE